MTPTGRGGGGGGVVVTGFRYRRVISRFDAQSTNRPTAGHTFVPIAIVYIVGISPRVWLCPGAHGAPSAYTRPRGREGGRGDPFRGSVGLPLVAFNIGARGRRSRRYVYVVRKAAKP